MDMGSIAAAVSGLNAATNLAKGFLELKSMAEVQGKVIELQSVILAAQSSAITAQSEQFAMLQQLRALKEEIDDVKAWETQKQRYRMVSPFSGATIYALLKAKSNGEPAHYICANCYENGRRSILQDLPDKTHWHYLTCPQCKSTARTGFRGPVGTNYAEEIGAHM